ncbi:MAG: F0F1 ATP synthase subunit epsilon [Terrimicrobiaceae bacterium]|jgi:F-type H+-transporting ATPase subunit epsilon
MLRLEIVTPEAKTFSDDVDSVVIPGIEGEMGILPMHVPLMTQLQPGELRVLKGGEETRLAVGEGFVEITGEKVVVLTDMAIKESDIDESAAEAAIHRAEEAMRTERLSDEEHAVTKAALQRSLALVRVKRRHTV